ncbi:helix-turn-helix domain-containing protein [Planosporangium sp. 12N6]|uniref:helix-turn-helix domain-containing protein n=1 Tax=Planosporangium spinosum TaxID=3402278 RepID=UPI003CE6F440
MPSEALRGQRGPRSDDSAKDARAAFCADLKDRISSGGFSQRQLAKKAGYARSTLNDTITGRAFPRWELVEDVLQAVGTTGDEMRLWKVRWDKVSKGLVPIEPDRGEHPPIAARSRVRAVLAGGIGGAFIGALVTYALVPARAPREVPVGGATVRIVNTDENGTPIGLHSYTGPTNESSKRQFYGEGDHVVAVCQRREGQLVRDAPYKDRPTAWPVWDRLDNGEWIPDMYTDLPKVPGSRPPNGLQRC